MGVTASDNEPLFTWSGSTGVFVHRGLDPATPDHNFQTALGGCCGYSPDIASNGSIHVLAWYSSASGSEGVWAQDVSPDSGAPVGAPVKLPGSTTLYEGEEHSIQPSTRTPIAAGHGGGDHAFYVGYTGGYPSANKMIVWTSRQGKATVVGTGPSVHTPAVSTDADGRVWTAWSEGGTGGTRVFARRSNPGGTRWGPPCR